MDVPLGGDPRYIQVLFSESHYSHSLGRRLVMTRDTTLVFPATRPQPLPVTKASIKQQAEEAVSDIFPYMPWDPH